MSISNEAVEAAAKAMYASQYADPFDRVTSETREEFLGMARAALEAAAPHMLAGVGAIAARLERSKQCEDREIAEDLRAALGGTK